MQFRPGERGSVPPQPYVPSAHGPQVSTSAVACASPRAALAAVIEPFTGSQANDAADQLLACVRPPDANFVALPRMTALLLTKMPLEGWDALQQHALASVPGVGISTVTMPDWLIGLSPPLVSGLKRLPGLDTVSLPVRGQAELELRGLECDSGRMPSVEIRRLEDAPLVVRAPPGMRVFATASFVAVHKSSVVYQQPNSNEILDRRTLAGQNYHHQHKGADGKATRAGQLEKIGIDLNFAGEFPSTPDVSRRVDRRIKCRHLALQWLADQVADKASGSVAPFPYGPYESSESISGHVRPETELQYMRMVKGGAQSLCEVGQFGDWMSREFSRMQDGQTRQFFLGTQTHGLSLQLRRKGDEYVVTFYDPNATATHQRLVVHHPSQLEGRSLANWIAPINMQDYFGDGASGLGTIAVYGFPPDPNPPATPARIDDTFVSDAGKASAEYLFRCLAQGEIHSVQEGMRSALGSQRSPAEMDAFRVEIARGLGCALLYNHTASVEICVASVLQANDGVLTADQKKEILGNKLLFAFMWGSTEVVAAFARMLANSEHLPLLMRYELLLAAIPCTDEKEDDAPLLQIVAQAQGLEAASPEIARKQHHAIFALLREIAASDLPLMTKNGLCGALYGDPLRTAASTALAFGNPGAAGAMTCAILEAGLDAASTQALLDGLGVSIQDVLNGLKQTRNWEDAEWAQRILASRS